MIMNENRRYAPEGPGYIQIKSLWHVSMCMSACVPVYT